MQETEFLLSFSFGESLLKAQKQRNISFREKNFAHWKLAFLLAREGNRLGKTCIMNLSYATNRPTQTSKIIDAVLVIDLKYILNLPLSKILFNSI